ncbi:MAG: tetratricopeptide repeat protein [Kyrpidia sp.]|nr:tetratricopeptide repeat protein [Kyrpidia sp.]
MTAISGTVRNGVVYATAAVTVVALLIGYNAAADQDKQFLGTFQAFQQSRAQMQKQQYAQAEPLLKKVVQDQPHSFIALWNYGICEFGLKQYDQADKYFTLAREQRPFLLMDQLYVTQYGQLLYAKGDLARAKVYLERSVSLNEGTDLAAEAKKVLDEIQFNEARSGAKP